MSLTRAVELPQAERLHQIPDGPSLAEAAEAGMVMLCRRHSTVCTERGRRGCCRTYLSKTVHMGDVPVIYNTHAQYQELSVRCLTTEQLGSSGSWSERERALHHAAFKMHTVIPSRLGRT